MNDIQHHDIIMVGGGPANLALAIALEEQAPDLASGAIIVEKNPAITWQPGALFGTARSQVNCLKDLVTLRDPRSKFTFLNYLKCTGRLEPFINSGTTTPYRFEISDYHAWVASEFDRVQIQHNRRVTGCRPVHGPNGQVTAWRVSAEGGPDLQAPVLVLGAGRDARLPEPLERLRPHTRILHSTEYLEALPWLTKDRASILQVAVLGSAQSSAELFLEAGSDFPHASRSMIMRSIGPVAYESSKFTNELFFTTYTDTFYDMPEDRRRQVLDQMTKTNYSAVAPHTLDALYTEKYLADYRGTTNINFRTMTTLEDAEADHDNGVILHLRDAQGVLTRERFDLVLCGTGFEGRPPALLTGLLQDLGVPFKADRNYEINVPGPAQLFAQGVNEETHGISDSLLSVLSIRSGEICQAIRVDQGAAHV